MGQDHNPPIHLTLVEYSMAPVNEKPLWRTSVRTHVEPNNASNVQKFTPSIFVSGLALDNCLYAKKKLRYKVSHRPFTFYSLRLNLL